ncbi:sensor histidine kinase [Luteolibacter flavescens]|uniref:Sensor histidine kinase n=1 Tax=Luteolibacter flavescens TaxID=1859460 RepID=A0ABT3FSP8_9BACT|nr:sensor histidine kinase [Luteolibacter flavescens]MCW1886334.1 sensor histidine kinase [Luteolibacter flavescens]
MRAIQGKAATEPFQPIEVKTSGVVTWTDPTEGRWFQIQDDTGGVQVTFTNAEWPAVGDKVEVTGVLDRGPYAPVIDRATFTNLGKSELPERKNASGGGLLHGEYNGDLVDVHGFVRSAEMVTPTTFSALLSSGSARITVRVSNARTLDPQKLIAAKVWLRGVAVPMRARGGLRQLVDLQVLAASEADFHVFEHEEYDPWKIPALPLEQAFQYRPGFSRGDRIRVRGEVIHHSHGVVYLNDGKSGIAVRGAGAHDLRRGDQVEAVGFPDLEDFLPILSDAVFASFPPEGPRALPKAMPVEDLIDGLEHANYVTARGRLLDRLQTPESETHRALVLALNTPHGVFTAELEGHGESIPGVEDGATLDVSGICLVSVDGAGSPTSFKILLSGPDQISVVEPASFFTVKRLLVMLSIVLGVLVAVILFAYLTTRRNLSLAAEMRERNAVTAERSRLARDLHDTLEQGLTGIHLRLHSIGPDEADASPETREHLQAVDSLVRQCHSEMRQSIWNLRSVALEKFDLAEALERAAKSLTLGSDIRVETRQVRTSGRLPALIEDNLLRIGQEAITNAVKHAKPTVITIDLQVTQARATLSVADDGSGIRRAAAPGRFGLTGMHERARRIGGTLRVETNSQGGTTVGVEVPLPRNDHESHRKP